MTGRRVVVILSALPWPRIPGLVVRLISPLLGHGGRLLDSEMIVSLITGFVQSLMLRRIIIWQVGNLSGLVLIARFLLIVLIAIGILHFLLLHVARPVLVSVQATVNGPFCLLGLHSFAGNLIHQLFLLMNLKLGKYCD